jgi:hypothetical protein
MFRGFIPKVGIATIFFSSLRLFSAKVKLRAGPKPVPYLLNVRERYVSGGLNLVVRCYCPCATCPLFYWGLVITKKTNAMFFHVKTINP